MNTGSNILIGLLLYWTFFDYVLIQKKQFPVYIARPPGMQIAIIVQVTRLSNDSIKRDDVTVIVNSTLYLHLVCLQKLLCKVSVGGWV